MAKNELFALDIGSGYLRGAWATLDENQIQIQSVTQTSYGGYMDGKLLEPEKLQGELLKILTHLSEKSEKEIKHIVVSLPSEFCGVIVKELDFEWQKETQITDKLVTLSLENERQKLKIEGNRVLHVDYIEFLDDDGIRTTSPIGKVMTKIKVRASFCYAVDEFCTYLENCLSNLGVEEVELVVAPLVTMQMTFPKSQRENGVLLMDNGCISSFVATAKGNGLTSLTSFGLGGGHISELLMENLNLTYQQAEELKTKVILTVNPIELDLYESDNPGGFQPIPARQVNRYVKLKVQQIANMVSKCIEINYFEWLDNTTLYITGSGLADLKGSKEILEESLHRNVEVVVSKVAKLNKPSQTALASTIHWWFKKSLSAPSLWERLGQKIKSLFKKNK